VHHTGIHQVSNAYLAKPLDRIKLSVAPLVGSLEALFLSFAGASSPCVARVSGVRW
jgi:hypothetical protein